MDQSRRNVMIGGVAAALLPMTLMGGSALAEDAKPVLVETSAGKLTGAQASGVCSFLGIPYGTARRFMAPEAAAPWTGVRDALAFGARAPQLDSHPIPPSLAGLFRFASGPLSEDCLVLNVWTPKADTGKRPVMVWLHGGGYALGSGQEPDYVGANLARRNDVVVVTLNHRLNVFGYCDLASVGGPELAQSGNAGLLDIVLALGWVRDNIGRFGGDAGNVTIFGQSGGGSKVAMLMAMPVAKGLFHRAIIMSNPEVRATEPAEAEENTGKLMAALGLGKSDIDKLRAAPMEKLVEAVGNPLAGHGINFSPVVDGAVLPSHPFDPAAPEVSASVPVLVGHTRDEMALMLMGDILANKMTDTDLAERVAALAGEARGPEVVATYKALYPKATPAQLLADIVTDHGMGLTATLIAERKARQGRARVHAYLVTWESPAVGGVLRAMHGVDVPLVFDNVDEARGLLGPGPAPQQMADAMSRAWVAFARSGNPDHPGIPKWPAFTLEKRETFVFDLPPRLADDPQAKQRQMWSAA
jgi:para-nitrobenzyl esterase